MGPITIEMRRSIAVAIPRPKDTTLGTRPILPQIVRLFRAISRSTVTYQTHTQTARPPGKGWPSKLQSVPQPWPRPEAPRTSNAVPKTVSVLCHYCRSLCRRTLQRLPIGYAPPEEWVLQSSPCQRWRRDLTHDRRYYLKTEPVPLSDTGWCVVEGLPFTGADADWDGLVCRSGTELCTGGSTKTIAPFRAAPIWRRRSPGSGT